MIDMHCHILSGIDDGASTLEESVRLCEIAAHNAIRTVVATPHLAKPDEVEDYVRLRDKKLDELRSELDKRKIELELLPGAEVFVNDDIFFAPKLNGATLNGSRYMLIEFEFRKMNINRLIRYVNEIFARGFVPIVAHPERYFFTQENYDIINHLADMGVLFQINAASLSGYSGFETQELGYAMVASGIASFIGTDAHSVHHRPNNILDLRERFPSNIDVETYDLMLGKNPETIIQNKDFVRGRMVAIRRKRFF